MEREHGVKAFDLQVTNQFSPWHLILSLEPYQEISPEVHWVWKDNSNQAPWCYLSPQALGIDSIWNYAFSSNSLQIENLRLQSQLLCQQECRSVHRISISYGTLDLTLFFPEPEAS